MEAVGGLFDSTVSFALSGTGLVIIILLLWWKGPRMLKPDTQKAYIVTGYKFPTVWNKEQFVIKSKPQMYLGLGSSRPEVVNLNSFSVQIERKGKEMALTLKDHVKAEVEAVFYIRVNKSDDAAIIQAKQSLGEIDEQRIREFLEPTFDAGLRVAAATMTIEEIHSERQKFLDTVKQAVDLKPYGLELTDVALRRFGQAALADFNANDSFDAQGLKKVTGIIMESEKVRNDLNQTTATEIAERNQQEEVKRLEIKESQRQAELGQGERIQQAEAEQAKRVAEFRAQNQQQADMAAIKAEEETGARRIAKDRELALAEEEKQRALAIAKAQREEQTESAQITKQKTVETAERDKQIALHAKAAEEAAAQEAANEASAKAVEAEQAVITVKSVAEADRQKQIEVIAAETEAGKAAASEKITAEARLLVAEKSAEAARIEAAGLAEAVKIEAAAESEAAEVRARAAYQEEFQKRKAVADGMGAEADAQKEAVRGAECAERGSPRAPRQPGARQDHAGGGRQDGRRLREGRAFQHHVDGRHAAAGRHPGRSERACRRRRDRPGAQRLSEHAGHQAAFGQGGDGARRRFRHCRLPAGPPRPQAEQRARQGSGLGGGLTAIGRPGESRRPVRGGEWEQGRN